MRKKTLKKSYISELFTMDNNKMKQFALLPYHRKIRHTQVARVKRVLREGKHFESPIVVNKKKGLYRIIDGGHRYTAIKEFLRQEKDMKVEINMATYHNLDEDEERKVFDTWNSGIKQSSDDFTELYKDKLWIWHRLKDRFPCNITVYAAKEGMKFAPLVTSYLSCKSGSFRGGIGSQNFIEKTKNLGKPDYKYLYSFMNGFISAFGTPGVDNMFSNKPIFPALMRVHFDNAFKMGGEGETNFWRIAEKRLMNNITLKMMPKSHGTEAREFAYVEILRAMNKGKRGTHKFQNTVHKTEKDIKEKD